MPLCAAAVDTDTASGKKQMSDANRSIASVTRAERWRVRVTMGERG
jgi:hypothetical protein